MKWFIYISFPILLLLNIYDIYSTSILIDLGVKEANPVLRWLMGYLGVIPTMVITKTIFIYILFEACVLCLTKTDVTKRENCFVISAFTILIIFYSYFIYTMNYQLMVLLT